MARPRRLSSPFHPGSPSDCRVPGHRAPRRSAGRDGPRDGRRAPRPPRVTVRPYNCASSVTILLNDRPSCFSQVERAFRCFKGLDLRVRPIWHRTETRVPAHIFLCMLAYYVEWHLRQAWAPLLFADEALPVDRWQRDPVRPARTSAGARRKKQTHLTTDDLPVQSWSSLLEDLATPMSDHAARQAGRRPHLHPSPATDRAAAARPRPPAGVPSNQQLSPAASPYSSGGYRLRALELRTNLNRKVVSSSIGAGGLTRRALHR